MLVAVGVVAIGIVFYHYNPYEHNFFPKCPLYATTGFQCPGCGSQRALHHLSHFEIGSALQENFLLVLAIPYLLLGFFLEYVYTGSRMNKVKSKLYGKTAAIIAFIAIVGWWVLRNLI